MKAFLITLLSILLIAVGVFLWRQNSSTYSADLNNQNSPNTLGSDGSSNVPIGYKLYENTELGFSILVPNDAIISKSNNNRIEIKFLGTDNEPATEIQDGFILTIFKDNLNKIYDSTLTYAEDALEETRSNGESQITQTLQAREVGGIEAYRYSYTTALGNEATEYVFLPDKFETGYKISYTAIDPNTVGYREIILNMLESVKFNSNNVSNDNSPPIYKSVNLAMLDYEGESGGLTRGCDKVVMIEKSIEPTLAPLTKALKELFNIDSEDYGGFHNFIAKTNDTLSFDHASVENGVASIYLNGHLSGLAGACDNPRAKIQIEETALQFKTVERVVFYLNGKENSLIPNAKGN